MNTLTIGGLAALVCAGIVWLAPKVWAKLPALRSLIPTPKKATTDQLAGFQALDIVARLVKDDDDCKCAVRTIGRLLSDTYLHVVEQLPEVPK